MKVIGLTGGIASGKSAVAEQFRALGATVLDADLAAHAVIDTPAVQSALTERWGSTILTEGRTVDRQAVAAIVFSDKPNASDELRFLEHTLHPLIREQFDDRLRQLASEDVRATVIDAPLLLEAGWQSLCDYVIFVDSAREKRLERAKQRNWNESEFTKREACQMPIAEKRRLSTHVIENDGTLEDLRSEVNDVWASLALI